MFHISWLTVTDCCRRFEIFHRWISNSFNSFIYHIYNERLIFVDDTLFYFISFCCICTIYIYLCIIKFNSTVHNKTSFRFGCLLTLWPINWSIILISKILQLQQLKKSLHICMHAYSMSLTTISSLIASIYEYFDKNNIPAIHHSDNSIWYVRYTSFEHYCCGEHRWYVYQSRWSNVIVCCSYACHSM